MKLFGQLVRTAVNLAALPVAVVKDVATLGGTLIDEPSAVKRALQQLKDEAGEP